MTVISLEAAADRAADVLAAGECVLIPTDTVYGLAVAAWAPGGAGRIAALKGREPDKPFALLVADVTQADELVDLTGAARELIDAHWPGPLTLVAHRRAASRQLDLGRETDTIGVRCPDHDWVRSLAERVGPIMATSANLAGAPPATTAAQCAAIFGPELLVIDGGTCNGLPSAVVQAEPFAILRPGPGIDSAP